MVEPTLTKEPSPRFYMPGQQVAGHFDCPDKWLGAESATECIKISSNLMGKVKVQITTWGCGGPRVSRDCRAIPLTTPTFFYRKKNLNDSDPINPTFDTHTDKNTFLWLNHVIYDKGNAMTNLSEKAGKRPLSFSFKLPMYLERSSVLHEPLIHGTNFIALPPSIAPQHNNGQELKLQYSLKLNIHISGKKNPKSFKWPIYVMPWDPMPAPPRYIWPVAAPDPWSLVQTDEWRIIEHTVTLKHRRQVMRLFTISLGEARYKLWVPRGRIYCANTNIPLIVDLRISTFSKELPVLSELLPNKSFLKNATKGGPVLRLKHSFSMRAQERTASSEVWITRWNLPDGWSETNATGWGDAYMNEDGHWERRSITKTTFKTYSYDNEESWIEPSFKLRMVNDRQELGLKQNIAGNEVKIYMGAYQWTSGIWRDGADGADSAVRADERSLANAEI